jgi:hypothetical protein
LQDLQDADVNGVEIGKHEKRFFCGINPVALECSDVLTG